MTRFFSESCAKFSSLANKISATLRELSQRALMFSLITFSQGAGATALFFTRTLCVRSSNKMEETLQEKVPAEAKAPDEEQGGIGRRLRDRELLRKRKAEAEERATNQWVYGAESSKRAKRETNNVQRKKGRPRKTVPGKEPQPETTEAQKAGETLTPSPAAELLPVPVPAPVSTLDSASIPAPMPVAVLELPQIPAVVSVPVPLPVPDVTLEMKPSSEALPQEVLNEDLGPDEEEDQVLPRDQLVIDQGGVEETSAIEVGEQNKVFSDTVLASRQPDPLPGNLI